MAKSPTDIATKQRHLALLGKVRSGSSLSASELKELNKYERLVDQQKAAPVIKPKAKASKAIKPKAKPAAGKKKTAKKPTSKKKAAKKKATKKIKRKRLPVSAVRIRAVAIEADSMAAAEVSLKTKRRLADIINEFPQLSAAWDRGRMLKNLGSLAATAATISEAGEAMALDPGQLDELLKTDPEVADIWNESRLTTIIKIKTAIVNRATDGNVTAAKQVETILRREVIHPTVDFTHLTTDQMIEITGKSRQTIHDWVAARGLGRNSDKTFNLRSFLGWYETFVLGKADTSKRPAEKVNLLQKAKAEELEMRLDKQRGNLLDRGLVIAGLVARHQLLVNFLERKPDDLAMACLDADQIRTAEILEESFSELRSQMCQVPASLRLPPEQAKKLSELIEELKSNE